MSGLFHAPLLGEIMLAALLFELALVSLLRSTKLKEAVSAALPGAFLILLMLSLMAGAQWPLSAALALGALITHLADLRRRGVW